MRKAIFFCSVLGAFTLFGSVARADDAACVDAAEQSLSLRSKGQLQDALKALSACADTSCPADVKDECARRIASVTAAQPTVIFSAKDGSGNDLSNVRVSLDGTQVATTLDGRPLTIDPGHHVFKFETDGQPPVSKELVLREGEKGRQENVVIGAPPAPTPPPPSTTEPPPVAPSTWSTQKTLALISGGIGIVGLGVGTAFGLFALSDKSDEKNNACGVGATSCNHGQAVEDYNTATTNATVSTLAFVAGAAFIAGGAVLWLTAPSAKSTTTIGVVPTFGDHDGGLILRGRF